MEKIILLCGDPVDRGNAPVEHRLGIIDIIAFVAIELGGRVHV